MSTRIPTTIIKVSPVRTVISTRKVMWIIVLNVIIVLVIVIVVMVILAEQEKFYH